MPDSAARAGCTPSFVVPTPVVHESGSRKWFTKVVHESGSRKWFTKVYPFIDGNTTDPRKAHEDEFILLQTKINKHANNNVSVQHWLSHDMSSLTLRNRCCL
jgi:hypothetical protein